MTTPEEQASNDYIEEVLGQIISLIRRIQRDSTLDSGERSILFSTKVLIRAILTGREKL